MTDAADVLDVRSASPPGPSGDRPGTGLGTDGLGTDGLVPTRAAPLPSQDGHDDAPADRHLESGKLLREMALRALL
jgi:hypothetical protein